MPKIIDGKKICTKCNSNKDVSEYGKNSSVASGIQSWCLSCCRIIDRKRTKDGRATRRRSLVRDYKLRKTYGITSEEFDVMFFKQGSKCRICSSYDPGSRHGWCVDHDHATNIVRAILCTHCNRLLGAAKDDSDTLRKAATFLDLMYVAY